MYEMDAVDARSLDSEFGVRAHRAASEPDRTPDQNAAGPDGDRGEGGRLMTVSLFGGAPWGFTLRGGREHGEPLIITKEFSWNKALTFPMDSSNSNFYERVEEGSKAAAVRLQAGDELINVNEFPLSGYRQEAICLVKGSHKTLSLVVKRRMKMVDIVAQKMPSESDVHVARSFLTKILRSSMRKSEPMSRPHSWHSTKFSENQSDAAKIQSTPSSGWQARYDASSYSSDLTTGWDHTNLRRVSDQFSSLGSMDSLEHGTHPYPPGHLSPSKSNTNSVEHLGGGKRDSAYSSFSTSSGTPDYTLSKSNAASTENVLYKVNHWDSGSRPTNGRLSQSIGEGLRQDDRLGSLQLSTGTSDRDSPRVEEQPGYRHSASGRSSIGPVWHIPDMKKNMAPSPPPPAPPLRSDSFAATKIHEKGLVSSNVEVPGGHTQLKLQSKGPEMVTEVSESTQRIYLTSESGIETCQNYNPQMKSDSHNSYVAVDRYNSNRTYSLSNTEVKAGHPFYSHQPYHQRQYSDESTFYAPSRTSSATKAHYMSSYSSMQELPTNSQNQHYNQNGKTFASLSSNSVDQNPDRHGSSKFYCIKSQLPFQGQLQAAASRIEDKNANPVIEMTQSGGDRASLSSLALNKDKCSPSQQLHYSSNKDSNGHYRLVDTQYRAYPVVSKACSSLDDSTIIASDVSGIQMKNCPPNVKHEQVRIRLREPCKEPSKTETTICPETTPMLFTLSQDNARIIDNDCDFGHGNGQPETFDPQNGRQMQRTERFATTLRNEIQMRRAQLQKSQSAAVLSESPEPEDKPSVWKAPENSSSSSDGSFTITYKDHLKEAQARVLKATSFRRRDLEPVLLEHPGAEVSASLQKDTPFLASLSEVPPIRPVPGSSHVTRICGRKRILVEKKARSYSEPEKLYDIGAEEVPTPQDKGVSLASRRKVFEVTGKPTYCKPFLKQNSQISEDAQMTKPGGLLPCGQRDLTNSGSDSKATDTEKEQDQPNSLQRLGTFAEYEATWSTQRKAVDPRTSGRYHSADNILDPGVDERHKPSYFHERSRSSPSDDFYGQVQGRKSAEYSPPGRKPCEHDNSRSRLSDGGYEDLRSKEAQEPSAALLFGGDVERNQPDPVSTKSLNPVVPALHFPDRSILTESSSFAKNKSSVSQRPPLPRLDESKCPEVTIPPATSQGGPASSQSPVKDTGSAHINAPKNSKGPKKEEEPQSEAMPLLLPEIPNHLSPPTMDVQRSPSPHFAPQRLTDKPPVSVFQQDEATGRMEKMIDNSTVKKVPIKIVHSECNTEKENRLYLYPNTDTPPSSQEATPLSLSSLGAPEQSSSPFCTYTRQSEQGNETVAPQKEEPHVNSPGPLQKDPCMDQSHNGVSISTCSQTEEDEKREVLTRDIIDKDKSLADILDQSKRRTTMDLMEGIFPQGEQLVEEAHQRKRVAPKLTLSRSMEERREEDSLASAALVTSSAYYSTSAPKAELLIKMKDMQEQSVEFESEEELEEEENDTELANKKHELIESLSRKLQVLREARESLQEDVQDNNALGEEVETTVQTVCKPNELEKFRMFVGDLDKVVSLLLSLSGRLARVENALNSLEEDAPLEERRTLMDKRKLLIRQHEDAKELKENLDRREKVVFDILTCYLKEESMADYEHFVKMKSALIIEQRKLEDKIKLGEEQLKCLVDSLPPEQRPRY